MLHNLYASTPYNKYWRSVALFVAQHFRKVPVDDVPYDDYDCRKWLKSYFFSLKWFEVYDFIEFVIENHLIMTAEPDYSGRGSSYHKVKPESIRKYVERILEIELSGFRFIEGVLTPISDIVEVAEIEEAIAKSEKYGLEGAHEHLHTSIKLLGKKPEPDYRNAIKEAISAVESVVKQITGSTSQGLEGALNELAKHTDIHGALKSGFNKLYGYTSDADGIRHGILEQPNVGFVEAKYMIVSCSAFVNYLILKANVAGLLKAK